MVGSDSIEIFGPFLLCMEMGGNGRIQKMTGGGRLDMNMGGVD